MPALLFWFTTMISGFTALACLIFFFRIRLFLPVLSIKIWLAFVVVIFLSAGIRFVWLPNQHNVFYDEFVHMTIGKTAYMDQKVGMDSFMPLKEGKIQVPKWGSGFYVLQAAWYHLFGFSENSAFRLNRVVSVLCVAGAFFLAVMLFESGPAGLWSVLIMSLYPLQLKFSTGLSIELASILSLQISLISLLVFLKNQSWNTFWLALFSTILYCLMRIDNTIIGIPVIIFMAVRQMKFVATGPQRVIFGVVLLFITCPLVYQMVRALELESGYHSQQIPIFIAQNAAFLILSPIHPASFTLFAVIGLGVIFKLNRHLFWVLSYGCLIPIIFYSFIHRVNFFHAGFSRFFLLSSPLLLLAAAKGLDTISDKKVLAQGCCALIVLVSCILPWDTIGQPYKPYFNQELDFIKAGEKHLPDDAVVLSVLPFLHQIVQAREAFNLRVVNKPEQMAYLRSMKKPILLYQPLVFHIKNPYHDKLKKKVDSLWQVTPVLTGEIEFPIHWFENPIQQMQASGWHNDAPQFQKTTVGFYALVEK